MDVLERANEMEREGVDIIHLEVGEPDFDTPDCVKEAASRALMDGHTHYTHSLGLYELREAICEYYASTYDVTVDPEQVVTPGIFVDRIVEVAEPVHEDTLIAAGGTYP